MTWAVICLSVAVILETAILVWLVRQAIWHRQAIDFQVTHTQDVYVAHRDIIARVERRLDILDTVVDVCKVRIGTLEQRLPTAPAKKPTRLIDLSE